MSTSLWKIDPQKLCTPTPDDLDQILIATYQSDDGTYYLDRAALDTLKGKLTPDTLLALQKEIEPNDGINFIIG